MIIYIIYMKEYYYLDNIIYILNDVKRNIKMMVDPDKTKIITVNIYIFYYGK